MDVKNLIIVLLVFSGVIVGLNTFTLDYASHYSQNIDDISALSQASEIESKVNDMQTAFSSKVTGTILDIPIAAVSGGVEFLQLVSLSLFGFWDALFNSSGIAQALFLPVWFTPIITTIIMVIVIFAAYHAIKWGY